MHSVAALPFQARGAVVALLFIVAAGLLLGPGGLGRGTQSAQATSLNEIKKVLASDVQNDDRFGFSVAVSGTRAIVGAYREDSGGPQAGAAYIFERDEGGAGNWGEITKLASSTLGTDDFFGYSVAISGNVAIVGARDEGGGAAYVFERNEGGANNWGEVKRLSVPTSSQFGVSVAVDGGIALIGAARDPWVAYRAGAAFLYGQHQGGTGNWGLIKQITASDAAGGDHFGTGVQINGDTAIVGAPGDDFGLHDGAAYIFRKSEGGSENWGEVAKLTASDAEQNDRFGHGVGVSGSTAVVGAWGEDSNGTRSGAAYVFERDEGGSESWGEVKKLTASDGQLEDRFGLGVAVSGTTAVVGAWGEDANGQESGSAYVYQQDEGGAGNWGQAKRLTASDASTGDHFGYSVAILGDTALAGASQDNTGGPNAGELYIFDLLQPKAPTPTPTPNVLAEVAKLLASDGEGLDLFGIRVSVSGDVALVGAMSEDAGGADAGAAYVFVRDQGGTDNWGEVKKLTASDAEARDRFGHSVTVSGDSAVVGASLEDAGGTDAGAAYVFLRSQGGTDNWGEVSKLTASDAQAGDYFGVSVSVSGDTAIVGASSHDAGGTDAGAVYIFERDEGGTDNWGQVAKLTASDAAAVDRFGTSVAASGDTVIVGARSKDGPGLDAGAAYVFQRDQGGIGNWGEVAKLTASDAEANDFFGVGVAINGETAVVGAYQEDAGANLYQAGAAYIFGRNVGGADNWGEVKKLTSSDSEAQDRFGGSVAIRGDSALIGAYLEDAGANATGAAYMFQRNQGGADNWGQLTKVVASDADDFDGFGLSVAIDSDTVLVGAYWEDSNGRDSGAAYVFGVLPPPPTPTPKPPDGDTDGDTVPNSADLDDDNDGCSDVQEAGPDETLGGLRNPHNPWDFYDVLGPGASLPKDGIIDLPNDILGVIQHHPAGALGYDVQFDRGPWVGTDSWNETQGPDGVIDLPNDILGVVLQFGHRCVP